jgi:hypothetical protein
MPNRSISALQDRYRKYSHLNADSPRLAKALPWSPIEEYLLLNLREKLGLGFPLIARLLGTQRGYGSITMKYARIVRARGQAPS